MFRIKSPLNTPEHQPSSQGISKGIEKVNNQALNQRESLLLTVEREWGLNLSVTLLA